MMKRKLYILLLSALAGAVSAFGMTVQFNGVSQPVIEITPEKSTGLEKIYVAYNTSEITEMRVSGISGNSDISKYGNLGGGYLDPIPFSWDGNNIVVSNIEGNRGYIVNDGGVQKCFWIVNYKEYPLLLEGLSDYTSQECDKTMVASFGEGAPIYYFSIDGRRLELSRDLQLTYYSLEWSEDSEQFVQIQCEKTLNHLTNPISVNPPIYCNTSFTLKGDRFLQRWGMAQQVESGVIQANGLDCHTTAVQTNLPDFDDENPSNVINTETTGMGGSAPVDIRFEAQVTDAVIHNEWQIASDQNFEYIQYRFTEQNIDHTFNEEGTYFVRYIGSNTDGTCETYGDTYTVSVGSSELLIPNIFTPNGDGINDEWKVSYRSLLNFRCWIFDRYGNEIFHFTDPSLGWDGKYKGKYVKAGVYFYVIEATGADGKKYKKGGDINIVKSKSLGTSDTSSTPEE